MLTREEVARQLERIRAHWPTMPATAVALAEYERQLGGFSVQEVAGGVTLIVDEFRGAAPPKPADVREAVGRVAKARRWDAAPVVSDHADAYCPHCGTTTLAEVPHPTDPSMPARLYPVCRPSCWRLQPSDGAGRGGGRGRG